MARRDTPASDKTKTAPGRTRVVGVRLTHHEVAAVDTLRGNLTASTWAAAIIRRELDKARAQGLI